jgi:hypothetical protein
MHYSDIYKNISHLSRLCFILEQDLNEKQMLVKQNVLEYMVLHLCFILSFLLILQFWKQLRSKRCNVHCDIFFMKMSVTTNQYSFDLHNH